MVLVEYTESAEDHRSILLLVQQVGSHLTPKTFTKLYDRVAKIQVHRIPSQNRTVHLRYKKFYPPESSEWGEFQAHRRALGVIALGKCNSPSELPHLYKLYEGIKQQYGSTLFDSRLVVFGIDPKPGPGSRSSTPETVRKNVNGTGTGDIHKGKGVYGKRVDTLKADDQKEVSENTSAHNNSVEKTANENVDGQKSVTSSVTSLKSMDSDLVSIDSITEKDSGKGDSLDSRSSVLSHPLESEGDPQEDSNESDHSDHDQPSDPDHFTSHVVPNILASDKLEKPAEKEDVKNGLSENEITDSDLTKPRSSSTISSDSGSSTASVVKEAPSHVIFYADAEQCSDLEARVADFIDALFWVLESKRLDRSQEKLDKLPMLATPFEKKDLVGVDTDGRVYRKRCHGRLKKQQGDLCLLAGLPGEALLHYQTAMDMLKSANDWLWLGAAQEGLCSSYVIAIIPKLESSAAGLARNRSFSLKRGTAASKEISKMSTGTLRGVPNGLDLNDGKPRLPDDIGDKYKDAISNYCKFKNAAVIEMEASIKACRVLATQQERRMSGILHLIFNFSMSSAMMAKNSAVSPPQLNHQPQTASVFNEDCPLDLSTSTKRPLAVITEKTPVTTDADTPIDLAPKRQKVDQTDLYSTPKKPTPLKPTPVASPNWYSNCLSKLASSVNTTKEEVKFQKSSAFTPVSAGSGSSLPSPGSSSVPTTGSSLPFSSPAAPSMMPFSMMNPWALGMDPTAMMGMFNPLLMAGAMGPMSGGSFPGFMPPAVGLKDSLVFYQKLIHAELLELSQKADPMSAIHSIHQQFRCECERIEHERLKALECFQGISSSAHKDSIHAYYDNQLYVCISYTKSQLEQEKKSFEMGGRLKPDTSNNLLTVPNYNNISMKKEHSHHSEHDSSDSANSKTTPPNQHYYSRTKAPHSISPIHSSTPQVKSNSVSPSSMTSSGMTGYSSMIHSPDGSSENSSNESGFMDSSDLSPNDGFGSAQKNRRFLSNRAIGILSEWYDRHSDHPYPDEDDVEYLSKTANVSECQVKKWMANKRVRSCNTLAFNGSIHPKKLQKLLQLKEAGVESDESTEASASAQNIPNAVVSQYGGLLNQVNVANGQVIFKNGERSIVIPHKPTRKQKAKRLLDPKAVEAMNVWYLEHIDYPYPTDDEKQQLANDNGLNVAQVTCWFANKRNRSNNTRKMTPQNKYRKSVQQTSPPMPARLVPPPSIPFPVFPPHLQGFPMPGMMGQ